MGESVSARRGAALACLVVRTVACAALPKAVSDAAAVAPSGIQSALKKKEEKKEAELFACGRFFYVSTFHFVLLPTMKQGERTLLRAFCTFCDCLTDAAKTASELSIQSGSTRLKADIKE